MSIVPRSEFPFERGDTSTDVFTVNVMWGYWDQVGEHLEWRHNPLLSISAEQQHAENKRNGFFGVRTVSKLERAQAIAAEVRARKFPAITKIEP